MDTLIKFFPVVYRKTKDPGLDSNYCKYDNHGLQLFTSSLYLAGLTSTFFASYTTRNLGRRLTMLIAGIFFIIGVVLNAAAQNLAMFIIGRIFLGCGVGFANQQRKASTADEAMTHQISPNYSSNMLADFSKMDQRLQLLKLRSSNLN